MIKLSQSTDFSIDADGGTGASVVTTTFALKDDLVEVANHVGVGALKSFTVTVPDVSKSTVNVVLNP